MNQNRIKMLLAGCGVVLLAVLSVVGVPEKNQEQTKSTEVMAESFVRSDTWMETDCTAGFVLNRFAIPAETSEHTRIRVRVPATTEAAVPAEAVSLTAADTEPEIQPQKEVAEAESQNKVMAVEPEPSEETVQVPVVEAVEAPGNAQVDTITVNPDEVLTDTADPDPIQNSGNTSASYSQAEQLASVQSGTTMIMGTSYTYLEQMVRYYNANRVYPAYYANSDAPTIEDFCRIYLEEAQAEGVRVEVAFCQAMKETGFLTYTGDVRIEQYNFAGIGATGGGVAGNSFDSVRSGIRAQIQHLKAYASTEALTYACVDPRFRYVKRGTTPYVEWLGIQENPNGGGWAAAKNYGGSIINDYIVKLFSF